MTYIKKQELIDTAQWYYPDTVFKFDKFERLSGTAWKVTYTINNPNYRTNNGQHEATVYQWTVVANKDITRNKIKINTNWRETVTSKKRINNAIGSIARLYQKDFVWYVEHKGETMRFEDGLVLSYS